ncbi:MAG: hypothetical protein ACLFOZ_20890 [Cyclobacteriaceae bacterium]
MYKINEILAWAEDNPSFDTGFEESVRRRNIEQGELSDKQKFALDNIMTRFSIHAVPSSVTAPDITR